MENHPVQKQNARKKAGSLLSVLTPRLRFFLAGEFFIHLSDMYLFFLPLVMRDLGASAGDIGLVYSLSGLIPLALHIVGGWLSDRFGRLRAITWGNLIKMASFAVLLLANRWEWMILVFTLTGIGWALGGSSYSAFIADQTAGKHRASVYAVQHNILNAVNLIKFPLAGWIAALIGFRAMLLTAALFFLAGTILLALVERITPLAGRITEPRPKPTFKKSFSLILSLVLGGGLFTWLFIIDHLNDIFVGLSSSLSVLYFQEVVGISIDQIGYLPTIGAVIALFVTIPLGVWVDKKGENIALGLAYTLLVIHIGSPLIADNFLGLIPSALVHPFMMGLAKPATQSLISKAIPEEQRGLAFGLTWTSRGILALPFPYLGGLLWETSGPAVPFLITVAGCLVLSLLAFWKLKLPGSDSSKDLPANLNADL